MKNEFPHAAVRILQTLLFLALCLQWEATTGVKTAFALKWTTKPQTATSTPTVPPPMLRTPEEIKKAMLKSEIIPDILEKAPKRAVLVEFEGNSTADLGNHLCIRDLEHWAPFIQWPANESEYYTLMMLNLDMPTREKPTQREWIVWLMGNIPGSWVMRGQQIIEYENLNPEEGTGSHRYVVLIYHQKKGKIKFRESSLDLLPKLLPQECKRRKFLSRFFADDYGLGEPIGINFWETEYEKKDDANS